VARLDYQGVQAELGTGRLHPSIDALPELGKLRRALAVARGAVELQLPEQEISGDPDGGWVLARRPRTAVDAWNAEISLLTGMAAARIMLDARIGVLRTLPDPEPEAVDWLRRSADALGIAWAPETTVSEFLSRLDPGQPASMALYADTTRLLRGAGYTAFDGERPAGAEHFAIAAPYAHATAPLRRLQDRFVSECCLAACAGRPVPDWVRAGLAALPDAMAAGGRRAGAVERGVIDLVEAVVLAGREGERFDAVVIDDGLVQLRDPAVRARVEDAALPEPGREVTVRLDRADPAARTVAFTAA